MNDDFTSAYSYLESPTSSESSNTSNHSAFQNPPMHSATSDYGLGYVWAPHYQQVMNQRDLTDNRHYCEPQYPAHPQLRSKWVNGAQGSYPYSQEPSVQDYHCRSLPIYAPVPLPGPSSILFTEIASLDSNRPSQSPQPGRPFSSQTCHTFAAPDTVEQKPTSESATVPPQMNTFMNSFSVRSPVQTTFPTPCELLSELGIGSGNNGASPGATSDSSSAETSAPSKNADILSRSLNLEISTLRPPESEAITSHEKKRQYLECLEQYVLYLHEQLRLIGAQPAPIERFSSYRGLSSRSIRTMLVHMENSTAKLNAKTKTEEQRFLALRDAYLREEGGNLSDPYVAASVETGEYYSSNAHFHTRPNPPTACLNIAGRAGNTVDGPNLSMESRMSSNSEAPFEQVYSAGP